ncbi:MAG: ATP-binding cassette domain-containing protein [Oscillospiraceae bacterium]|jgi:molybdate transport system ATP-binding protein|nr:ATP-binding cassette domain-containing protein [Oscillospiraceae bacterium]
MLEVSIKKKVPGFTLDTEFAVGDGETLGLLGASGCGKSMTIRCIAGILKPDKGRIVLNGRVLFDSEKRVNLPPRLRNVGYLFQSYALFPNMTVLQNVESGIRATGALRRKKAGLWIEKMRLSHRRDAYPRKLSGGERQRCALARMFAAEPELLLFDEPLSALDAHLRTTIELELLDFLKAYPNPAVFVSHSRDEVAHICENICVLENGHGHGSRPTRDVFRRPETVSAALLSGMRSFSRIERLSPNTISALDWGGAVLTVPDTFPETSDTVGVRSHFVKMSGGGAVNEISAEVARVIRDVAETTLFLRAQGGGELTLKLPRSREGSPAPEPGDAVTVTVAPEELIPLNG